jgi:hypothetical protein
VQSEAAAPPLPVADVQPAAAAQPTAASQPSGATPADTGLRGPCEQCQHLRQGGSITGPTFTALLDSLKPKVSSSHTQKMQEELQESGEAQAALNNAIEYGRDQWNRRPTARTPYCGVDEFEGRYYVVEVKNANNQCPQHTPRRVDAAPHNCRTCAHNAAPMSAVLLTAQQTLGKEKEGRDLRVQQVDPALEAEANIEYRDCVDGQGFMYTRPGMLPVCEVYSQPSPETGDQRFVVGPVVNTAARCPSWEAGPNPRSQRIAAQLAAMQAEAARTEEVSSHPPAVYFDTDITAMNDALGRINGAAGNDQADIIEFGLTVVGLNADFVHTIGSVFMDSGWYLPRARDLDPAAVVAAIDAGAEVPIGLPGQATGSGAGGQVVDGEQFRRSAEAAAGQAAPAQTSVGQPGAAAQPSPPFGVQPMVAYQHPSYPQISFQVVPTGMQVLLNVRIGGGAVQFDLAAFPPGAWTQLQTPQGPLPITILPQLPAAVYAAWY